MVLEAQVHSSYICGAYHSCVSNGSRSLMEVRVLDLTNLTTPWRSRFQLQGSLGGDGFYIIAYLIAEEDLKRLT